MNKSRRIRVVVVDDDLDVLKTFSRILSRRAKEVFPFQSPEKALEFLKSESVDLIFSDVKMPEMDGVLFLRRAKMLQPNTPLILVTGFASIDTAVSAIHMGAFDYLKKPVEMDRIYEVMDSALERGGGTP